MYMYFYFLENSLLLLFYTQVQTDESGEKEVEIYEDDSPELARFLRDIEPFIREQLQRNLRSHAFDGD